MSHILHQNLASMIPDQTKELFCVGKSFLLILKLHSKSVKYLLIDYYAVFFNFIHGLFIFSWHSDANNTFPNCCYKSLRLPLNTVHSHAN